MKYLTTTTANTLLGLCIFAGLATAPFIATAETSKGDTLNLDTPAAKAGYSIGTNIGAGLKRDDLGVTLDSVIAGLTDSFTGAPEQLSAAEREAALAALQEEMVAKANAERDAAGAVAKMAGEEFLGTNKSKEGVKTLPSGLQYKIVKEGEGTAPKTTDSVTVNYKGTLIDGTVFDSSYDRGEPVTFPVEGVIAGWTEALQLMKPGSKWEIFVPSDLAYGENGAGRAIPPHAALVFDVELLKVNG
jgi:FKBP-type peptidyl-prolyl cis-trans isomerase FklB